jgi:sigma-B regulation protein RsbU (phosphoserine phosphatase)
VTWSAGQARLPSEKVVRTRLALEEAIVNICRYAYLEGVAINRVSYAYSEPGRFTIRLRDKPAQLEIELEDQGAAFNPLVARAPDVQSRLEERDLSGLGILLIRKMVDQLRYARLDAKNILTMIVRKE